MKAAHPQNRPIHTSWGSRQTLLAAATAGLVAIITPASFAANITKAGSGTDLTAGASWTGSVAPSSNDVATWDTGSLGAGLSLNSGTPSWLGIKVNAGASDAISIGSGGTLTLGRSGVDLSASAINATLGCNLSLAGGFQPWLVASGRTLAINGTVSRLTGGSVNFPTNGVTSSTLANNNGILGGWATVGNAGTGGASGDWATIDGSGNVTNYTGHVSITGTVGAGDYSTENWKVNNAAASLTGSAPVNSVVLTTDFNVQSGATLTLNSGGLILSGNSRWFKNNGAGNIAGTAQITSGLASGELFVDSSGSPTSDADWRIWPKIVDNGATPVILVKNGPGYVRLPNANTYSGGTILNGGRVLCDNATSALGTGPLVINGNVGIWLNVNLTTSGALSGAGTLDNTVGTGGASWNINGDLNNFTGTIAHFCDNSHNNVNLGGGTANSVDGSQAKVVLSGNNGQARKLSLNGFGVGNFLLGDLSGASGSLLLNNSVNIGYLNLNSTFGGWIMNGANSPAVTKVGTGSLTLSGASTYPGATTVENGALIAGANVPVSGNGPFGNASSDIALGNATSESANQNVALLVGGAFTMARPVTVGAGNATTATFTLGGNTANSASVSGNVALNQSLIITQATGGTLTIAGSIYENIAGMNVTKAGGGTVILSGANSYTGSTVVSNGVLMVGNPSQGNGPVTVANGATAGVSATADATYWSPSSLTVNAGGALQFNLGGTITGPNFSTLLTPASLTLNGTTTINVGSCPQVVGLYPLFNNYSSGTLTLGSQPAGILGKLTVSSGTVYYEVTNFVTAVWTAAVNTNWDTVTANWTNTIGGNKYVAGYPVLFDDTAVGTSPLLVNITNAVAPNSFTVNNTSKAYIIGGLAIGGTTGLTKNGNNTLTLTGTNSFTGAISISGGSVEVGGDGQLGGGAYSADIANEGTLKINSTAAQTLSGIISGNGALIKAHVGTLTLSGGNSYFGDTSISNGTVAVANGSAVGYGTVTLAGGTLRSASEVTLANNIVAQTGTSSTIDASENLTLNGNLQGGGTITRGSANTRSLFLSGDNSGFTGTYQDQNSGNSITRWNSANSGSANARWIFNQAQLDSRTTANFGSGTIQFGSISGAGYFAQNSVGTATVEVGALGLNDTFSGSLRNGAGLLALTKVGTGTLTLSGANTYSGPTMVNSGALVVSTLSTGAGDYTVADGATLGVGIVAGGSLNVASLTLGNNSTNAFLGLSSTVNPAINNLGALTVNGTVAVSVQQTVLLAGVYPLITSTSIGGVGEFVLGTLPGGVVANLQTNGTTIELNVTTGTPPFVWTGLTDANWDLTTANNWTSNAVSVLYTNGQLARFDDTSTRTNVTVGSNVAPGLVLVTNSTRSYTFSGAAITGSGGLTKTGNGLLTLANTNTYTGGTLINNGTLQLGDGVANNGVVAGGIADNANLVVANPVDQTLANVISGSGNVAKTGAGVLTVSGANTFAGTTTIKQGTVNVSAANNLSTNTVILGDAATGADAALQLTAAIGVGNSLTVAPGAGARKLANNSGTTATHYGGIALSNNLTVIKTGGQDLNLEGVFTGSGNVIVSNTANIVWFKTASPDWTGSLILQAGNVRPGTASMQMNTNTVLSINTGAFFNVGGANYDLDFAGVNDIPGATGGGMGGGSNVRDIVLHGSGTYTYSGVFDSRSWGLSVNLGATGKQILTGNNTYDRATTVNSGTLLVNGSVKSDTVVNGGVLGGTGTFNGVVTVNSGGILSPGASVGTLTVSNNLNLAGDLLFELNKSLAPGLTNDYVIVTGTLINTGTGTLTLSNVGPALVAGDTFKLFNQLLSGGDLLTLAPTLPGSLAWTNNLALDGTVAVISASATPPPARLTNNVSGGMLSLSWPAGEGWSLQVQTNSRSVGLGTNWFTVPGSSGIFSTNITVNSTNPTVFFRLVYP